MAGGVTRMTALAALMLVAGCGGGRQNEADLKVADVQGPNPRLIAPRTSRLPNVNIARADPWKAGEAPLAANGLKVAAFASGLDHPRWLLVLPNGDVLAAETDHPRPRGRGLSLGERIQGFVMRRAGAAEESPNRIVLLRDADGDGTAETKSVLLSGLSSPFGMALVGGTLYLANADALVAFPYELGQTKIDAPARKIVALPAGRNHHWTKSLVANADGSRLYVGVGSNSNIGENGLDEEKNRAAILEVDPATGAARIYASGLRNPVGMDWNPASGQLWVSVNERDEIGSDLPPDYMTQVQPGGFYGWPWSYWGRHVDARVEPANPAMVARAIQPDYALGPHTASLGFTFAKGAALGPVLAEGAFVGQHGSWNRTPRSGYKVIFVPFRGGRPSGMPIDILTGFLSPEGKAHGRPVGVAIAKDGALLVADDVGGTIWRVSRARELPQRPASLGRETPR